MAKRGSSAASQAEGPAAHGLRLVDIEPDLLRVIAAEERAQAGRVMLPVVDIPRGDVDVPALLQGHAAYAALVIDGLLLRSLRLGTHGGLSVVGPGEILGLREAARSPLLAQSDLRAEGPVRMALLGTEMLHALRRWPQLAAALQQRVTEQIERLSTQLMVCQLPRVEDRLLAMLWVLADTWGKVTATGTSLPVSLTHQALGGLVGARRSTVTLALTELSERGALIRPGLKSRNGWASPDDPAHEQRASSRRRLGRSVLRDAPGRRRFGARRARG